MQFLGRAAKAGVLGCWLLRKKYLSLYQFQSMRTEANLYATPASTNLVMAESNSILGAK